MRSPTSPTCRLHRHFGAVALHNCALRIIGESGEDAEDQLAGWCGRINGGSVTGEDFEANALLCQIVHRINQMTQVAAESR